MTQSVLPMVKDLAVARIQAGNAPLDEMQSLLSTTYTTLRQWHAAEPADPINRAPESPVAWQKSIGKHAVTCLECRATFRQLSARHLRVHDLDGWSYRDKHGIPRTQSLSAHEVLIRRRQVIHNIRRWERKGVKKKQRRLRKVS